jgi:hypothetical protein
MKEMSDDGRIEKLFYSVNRKDLHTEEDLVKERMTTFRPNKLICLHHEVKKKNFSFLRDKQMKYLNKRKYIIAIFN